MRADVAARVFSFILGVLAAAVFSFMLYRIGLPLEPFIYVGF